MLATSALLVATLTIAADHTISLTAPTLDKWMYPFGFQGGSSQSAPIFSSWIDGSFSPSWDNRDGQMLVGFDVSSQVPIGLPPSAYDIQSLTLTLWVGNDLAFEYDPTLDPVGSYGPDVRGKTLPDPDPGRPVEAFLADFRYGYTPLTFEETTPYSQGSIAGKGVRSAYPISFDSGAAQDVSNNMDTFTVVTPAAIGLIDALGQGEAVPIHQAMRFEIDLSQPLLRQALQERIALGRLHFCIASIFNTEVQGSTGYPRFHTKESLAIPAGLAFAPRLEGLVVLRDSSATDLDGDGIVGPSDLAILLGAWGTPGPGDLDGDGVVGSADLAILLGAWSG
jgi:hypothetical protein